MSSGVHAPRSVTEAIFGTVDQRTPPLPLVIVNPAESEPTGWGAPNSQRFQSSRTNAVGTNQSAEVGMGVGPERQWGHYPHATNPNPFRRMAAFLRDGGDAYSPLVYRPEVVAYWSNALAYEAAATPVKQAMRPDPVVNPAPSVPYVTAVSPGGYYG